jgi:hypothetical protein
MIKKEKAKIGDVINGWEILDIFSKNIGSQNVNMARIKSTVDNLERNVRLTILTNKKIGYPDRSGPDLSKRNTTHGLSGTRLHRIWCAMKTRCYNKNQKHYYRYGGRGITVCNEWKNDFIKFKNWSESNGYSDELSIDRIDNNGNYCPENCRWSTYKIQNTNRRKQKHLVVWLKRNIQRYTRNIIMNDDLKKLLYDLAAHNIDFVLANLDKVNFGNRDFVVKVVIRLILRKLQTAITTGNFQTHLQDLHENLVKLLK